MMLSNDLRRSRGVGCHYEELGVKSQTKGLRKLSREKEDSASLSKAGRAFFFGGTASVTGGGGELHDRKRKRGEKKDTT